MKTDQIATPYISPAWWKVWTMGAKSGSNRG